MNWQDKRIKYAVIAGLVITAIVCFRILSNITTARDKAKKAAAGKTISVTTGFPKRVTITPRVKLSGTLDPVWQADIGSKLDARITEVYAKVGDNVVAGQVLARLDRTELTASVNAAKGNVFDARSNLASAETTYARYEKLLAAGAISAADYDNARFARDMAAGKLEAAVGTYEALENRLEGAEIVTPQDGTVVKRYYQEGFYATAATPIFKVADTSSLVVKVDIPEGQIGYMHLGTKTKIIIPAMNNMTVEGTVTKLAQVADMPARTFAAEITVDNSNNALRGGLFANVYMTSNPRSNVLTVPELAIVMREDQRTVYVVGDDGKVIRRVLDTGYIGDGVAEVISGVDEKDEIVLTGQNKVREGSTVKRDKDGGK